MTGFHEGAEAPMSAQSAKMRRTLEKLVIAPLKQQGFEGEYPHFRRVTSPERIELIVVEIGTGRYGNSFGVCGSVIFPKETAYIRRNFHTIRDDQPLDEINVYYTRLRKSLKAKFGEFYYTDVYEERMEPSEDIPHVWYSYEAVSEKRAATFQPRENQRLVQKYDENTCAMLAEEAKRQMPQLLNWMAEIRTPRDLVREHRRNQLRRFKFYRWIEERFKHV